MTAVFREGPPPDTSGMALAQGDLAVNLFIVLVVVLSTLTVAKVSSRSDGFLAPYRRAVLSETPDALVTRWQPVLPVYPKLVAHDERVYLTDLTALARSFARAETLDLGPDVADTSRMREGDLDPSASTVFLRFYGKATFPEMLSAASLPLDALDTAEGHAFLDRIAEIPKVDLLVYSEQLVRLGPLMDALYNRNLGVRMVVMPRKDVFGFVYSGGDFGLERTFK